MQISAEKNISIHLDFSNSDWGSVLDSLVYHKKRIMTKLVAKNKTLYQFTED